MNPKLHLSASITALCALLFAGCDGGKARSDPKGPDAPPRTVRVGRAALAGMPRTIAVTGTLAAREASLLSAKVPGRIEQLKVDIGSAVRQGEVLAQIEPRDYQLGIQLAAAALAQARAVLGLPAEGQDDELDLQQASAVKQARAVLDEASKNRDRVDDLSESGIASRSERDTVEATYKVALTRYDAALEETRTRAAALAERRVEYEQAVKRLADASLRAPFDGVVQARLANLGEFVAAGTAILQLVKPDPLRLRLEVPERESVLVQTGQVVRLKVEGDQKLYFGKISRLSPALDPQSRMLIIEADVPAQGSLRPGLFARSQIVVNESERVLTIPAEAIVTFAGLEKVVAVQDGKAVEKTVVTGRRENHTIEILSGLKAEELVVLNPGGLRTGQRVTFATESPSSAAESPSPTGGQ